jgi:hypothetical protein
VFPQFHGVAVKFVDSELEFSKHLITQMSVTLHQEEVWQLTTKLVRNRVAVFKREKKVRKYSQAIFILCG